MIINIRGTHGSGKSTIVRTLMRNYSAKPEGFITMKSGKQKPRGYTFQVFNRTVYVVGSYETTCGGCDAIQPYSLIWPLVEEYASKGSVLFEGALVSSSYGSIGRNSEVYGNDFVFAFLNTPLNVCLARIKARREAKGNMKPVDPKNTEHKLLSIEHSIPIIQNDFGRRVEILDYHKPIPQVLKLLRLG